MSAPKPQVSEELREELNRSGVPWCVEHGRRHDKLYVGGRMVQVLTRGRVVSWYADANALACVRRAVKNWQLERQRTEHR